MRRICRTRLIWAPIWKIWSSSLRRLSSVQTKTWTSSRSSSICCRLRHQSGTSQRLWIEIWSQNSIIRAIKIRLGHLWRDPSSPTRQRRRRICSQLARHSRVTSTISLRWLRCVRRRQAVLTKLTSEATYCSKPRAVETPSLRMPSWRLRKMWTRRSNCFLAIIHALRSTMVD